MKNPKSQLSSLKNPVALGAGELAAVDGGAPEAREKRRREPETLTVTTLPSGVQIHGHEGHETGYHAGNIQLGGEHLAHLDPYEVREFEMIASDLGYETKSFERPERWV